MSEEEIEKDRENKAIKFYKSFIEAQEKELDWMEKEDEEYYKDEIEEKQLLIKGFKTILNLIENQQKEIEESKISLLQYENLRKHFNRMTKEVLGEGYYNMAMDVYKSDEIACDDIINKKVKVSFPTKKMSEEIWQLKAELEKKKKIIDLMAESIANNNDIEYEVCDDVHETQGECDGFAREAYKSCKQCIKQYFERKCKDVKN